MKLTVPMVAALVVGLVPPAGAETQTYAMQLGNRVLGQLELRVGNGATSLATTLDNTPLGLADGTFGAVSRRDADGLSYRSENRGAKVRDIAVTRQGPRVTAVEVRPEDDATDASAPATVPAGVLMPTEVFATLAQARGCPSPMAMYDGRRVVQLGTTSVTDDGGSTLCDLSYRVVAGPGHLSPFRFRSIGVQLEYGADGLARIRLSAGGFDLDLIRD